MQTLGLSADDRRLFEETLRKPHSRRVMVYVTDLEENVLSALRPVVLDGQVNVDAGADVTRSATLSFLDPARALSFDTDSPDDGALYADRMLRIDYEVHVEALGGYVPTTIFLGPVTKLDRAGDVVSVEAQGKEALANGAVWQTITLKKGYPVVDAIRLLLRDRAGERRFAFASLSSRLPKTRSLDRFAEVWETARKLASSVNRQLFYDGSGACVLRAYPSSVVYTFREGDGSIVGDVQVSYVMDDVKNLIIVEGATPSGSKTRVRGQDTAEPTLALSPRRLGRNGVPRYRVEVVTDDAIRSDRAAQTRAESLLADRIRETVEVTFDALPVPHLDPDDLVRIETPEFSADFRLRRFSIPLGTEGDPVMPVGYLKRTSVNRKRFRR